MKAEVFGFIGLVLALIAILASRLTKPCPVEKMPEPSPEVHDLIKAGAKIGAIRLYRKETGASLLEANRVIDFFSVEHS